MADIDGVPEDASGLETEADDITRADEVQRRTEELVEFRDAGVLSEAEFEEQKVKLRWGIGR
jgi:hypothetical protein